MNRFLAAIAGASFALTSPSVAHAQTTDSAETSTEDTAMLQQGASQLLDWLRGERATDDTFAPQFLAAIPAAQLEGLKGQLLAAHGAPVAIEQVTQLAAGQGKVVLRLERALGTADLAVLPAAPHLIAGLRFTSFEQVGDTPEKIASDMAALSGSSAAWFGPLDGEPVFAHGDPAKLHAIGSTFKLYVLAALVRGVEERRLSWDQVVPLTAKSLPSGIMQNWPEDAPVTLHTLATLMISISDNTATDLLIDTVGRGAIEAELRASGHSQPESSLPFLKTFELFALKAPSGDKSYAEASVAERRVILARMERERPAASEMAGLFADGKPVAIDTIEWFASMQDHHALMSLLASHEDDTARQIMAVNKGFAEGVTDAWDYVGFKGGSEPGVLNMAWLLRDKAGRWHMLAASWNDQEGPVQTETLLAIAQRILALGD